MSSPLHGLDGEHTLQLQAQLAQLQAEVARLEGEVEVTKEARDAANAGYKTLHQVATSWEYRATQAQAERDEANSRADAHYEFGVKAVELETVKRQAAEAKLVRYERVLEEQREVLRVSEFRDIQPLTYAIMSDKLDKLIAQALLTEREEPRP